MVPTGMSEQHTSEDRGNFWKLCGLIVMLTVGGWLWFTVWLRGRPLDQWSLPTARSQAMTPGDGIVADAIPQTIRR